MFSIFSFSSHTYHRGKATRSLHFLALVIGIGALVGAGCSKPASHVPVHPVAGVIKFQGQPAAGAFVALQAKNAVEGTPCPRATVAQDGTFRLSTFSGNDGAPEGDYVLTVQWRKPIRQDGELVGGPNVIPQKYAAASTSDLVVHVAAGDNQLKPILLR